MPKAEHTTKISYAQVQFILRPAFCQVCVWGWPRNSLKLSRLIIMEFMVGPQATCLPQLKFFLKLFAAMIFWLIRHDIFQHTVWYAECFPRRTEMHIYQFCVTTSVTWCSLVFNSSARSLKYNCDCKKTRISPSLVHTRSFVHSGRLLHHDFMTPAFSCLQGNPHPLISHLDLILHQC